MNGLSCVPGNPVHILVKKLNSFISNYIIGDTTVGPFDNHSQPEEVSSTNQQTEKLNIEEEVVRDTSHESLPDANLSLCKRVLQKIQANCHSFVICGAEVDFFRPPSSQTHPISHKLVVVKTFTEPATASKVKADLEGVLEVFMREICSCLEDLKRESGSQSLPQTDPPSVPASPGSETVQLKSSRQTKFQNITNAASAGTKCECRKQAVQEKCIFCRLESHYLGYDISPQVCLNDLFQPSTQTKLYHKERLLLSCGVLDSNKSSQVCWLMDINIDSLVMALCGISDIRLLWSKDQRFKEQFSGLEVRLLNVVSFIVH